MVNRGGRKPTALDNQRNEVNHMKTFLVIELFVMYQLFVIGFVVMVAKDVISSIKKHKK